MSDDGRENGFTLIEMMVALAVFSLAALALLRLEGTTITNASRMERQLVAQVVARNIAVETVTDPIAPSFGRTSGRVENGGIGWRWTRSTARSPEASIQMITITVEEVSGSAGAALTVFRQAAR